jgi:hypothetical protein
MSQAPGFSGMPDAHDSREACDEAGGLDLPNRLNRAMSLGRFHN